MIPSVLPQEFTQGVGFEIEYSEFTVIGLVRRVITVGSGHAVAYALIIYDLPHPRYGWMSAITAQSTTI